MASICVCGVRGLWVVFLVLLRLGCSEGQMVPAAFVFGDSLVDVGNNNHLPVSLAKADFPHNGMDFPTKKATGRFSNGKNTADFLAEKLGLPPSPPYLALVSNSSKSNSSSQFLTGVSFASGGAGILDGTADKYKQSIPLTKQVEYYLAVHESLVQHMGSSGAKQHVTKSLFHHRHRKQRHLRLLRILRSPQAAHAAAIRRPHGFFSEGSVEASPQL